jgi:hypothetical protein
VLLEDGTEPFSNLQGIHQVGTPRGTSGRRSETCSPRYEGSLQNPGDAQVPSPIGGAPPTCCVRPGVVAEPGWGVG